MPYLTAKQAWTELKGMAEDHGDSNAISLLHQWWAHPADHPEHPFQYCTTSGLPVDADENSCGCLTQVKGTTYCNAQEEEWTLAIRADDELPKHIDALEDTFPDNRPLFTRHYTRMVKWQKAMRHSTMPKDLLDG